MLLRNTQLAMYMKLNFRNLLATKKNLSYRNLNFAIAHLSISHPLLFYAINLNDLDNDALSWLDNNFSSADIINKTILLVTPTLSFFSLFSFGMSDTH